MGAVGLAIASLVVNAGAATYGIIEGEAQRDAAEKAHNENLSQQEKMLAEENKRYEEQQAKIKKEEDALAKEQAGAKSKKSRDTARARQRSKAQAARGRSSTILTGPSGLTDEEQVFGKKTILGK